MAPGWYAAEFVNEDGKVTGQGVAFIEPTGDATSDNNGVFFDGDLFRPERFFPGRLNEPVATSKGLRLLRLGKRVNLPIPHNE